MAISINVKDDFIYVIVKQCNYVPLKEYMSMDQIRRSQWLQGTHTWWTHYKQKQWFALFELFENESTLFRIKTFPDKQRLDHRKKIKVCTSFDRQTFFLDNFADKVRI